jgi:hypothetical protein
MKVFEKLPRIAIPHSIQFLAVIPPVVVMVAMIFTMNLVGPVHRLIDLFVVIFSGILSLWSFPVSTRIIGAYFESGQSKKDRQTFDASPLERHVGVAYCDYFWSFRSDTSWDRGFISYDSGFVTFRGFGPSFCLPVSAIHEVWISVSGYGLWEVPRVFVRWNHPESGLNTVSFEIRTETTQSACFEKAKELETWLNCLPRNYIYELSDVQWPFQSSTLDFAKLPSRQFAVKSDVWVAGAWGIGLSFSFVIVNVAIHHFAKLDVSFLNTLGAILGLTVYKEVIRSRVVAKGNF